MVSRLRAGKHPPIRENLLDFTLETVRLERIRPPEVLLPMAGERGLDSDRDELERGGFLHAPEHLSNRELLFKEEVRGLLVAHLDSADAHACDVTFAHEVHAAGLGDGSFGCGRAHRSRRRGFPDAFNGDGLGEVSAERALEIAFGGKCNTLETGDLCGPVELEVSLVGAERIRRHVCK